MKRLLLLLLLAGCDGWPESPKPPAPAPPPEGAVARGSGARLRALAPPGPTVDSALLAEGAERYAIFCTPCHGARGTGDGVVVSRGHPPIAPLPADAARSMAAIAENHLGAHPLADRLDPRQRWAVARYVEALMREGR
ncbi:Cytochrome C oxidase, cbb3-type, subunit III [Roseomonas rosea]|uniref:Cytochrome C oxidase, cbb3-type, subunit III n=1 Tax=Muricoccus roseus TaxID=198092 RepID=A0A1M6C9L5_9PROT|nr:cytochrome c [Roseomonas rosea]SHI57448.1 Cytochrome C oxidase, cbb3-type, subunit III [Roseomonas rosea]